MGLFHKTVMDIKNHIDEGKINEAVKIGKKHIKEEHHFEADLTSLQRWISHYAEYMRRLSKMHENGDPAIYQGWVEEAINSLQNIHYLLEKLEKEEKTGLE